MVYRIHIGRYTQGGIYPTLGYTRAYTTCYTPSWAIPGHIPPYVHHLRYTMGYTTPYVHHLRYTLGTPWLRDTSAQTGLPSPMGLGENDACLHPVLPRGLGENDARLHPVLQ